MNLLLYEKYQTLKQMYFLSMHTAHFGCFNFVRKGNLFLYLSTLLNNYNVVIKQ